MSERDTPIAPMVALMRGVAVDPRATVSLERVVRQRQIIAEFSGTAGVESAIDTILSEACRYAAAGSGARYSKILEHRPEEHQFIVRAGWGWQPGVVGHARAPDDMGNPAGESFQTSRPVTTLDIRQRADYHLPPIYPDHHIVSTSNVPILGLSGFYGVLEVDHPSEHRFDAIDTTFLISLAGIVAHSLERAKRENALRAAHNATALLLREHYHRVRNNFQTILALVQAHARQATTANSRQRMEDIGRRIFALSSLYDHLLGAGVRDRVDLTAYIVALCERMKDFYCLAERPIGLECGGNVSVLVDIETCTTLGLVVNELVANAVEHAFSDAGGRIAIAVEHSADGNVEIRVVDDGKGFTGTPPAGIGLSVARRLMSWMGGSLARSPTPGGGTSWTVCVPGKRVQPAAA